MPTGQTPSDGCGEPLDESRTRPRAWAIGSDLEGCAHPRAELDHLGDDGLNGYYRCRRCSGVVVIGEAVLVEATDRG